MSMNKETDGVSIKKYDYYPIFGNYRRSYGGSMRARKKRLQPTLAWQLRIIARQRVFAEVFFPTVIVTP